MFARALLFFGLFFPFSAFSAITINASVAPYNQVEPARNVGVISTAAERQAAMAGLVGMYRSTHGFASIPAGTVITFKWQDGSSEKGMFLSPMTGNSTEIIPGTQSLPPGGGVGYTTNPSGGFIAGPSVVGFNPIYTPVTVCVSGVCEAYLVVTGYEWIYATGTRFASVVQ